MSAQPIFVCVILCAAFAALHAFEENSKFCISTEPMLLADMEKHVNPIADDPHCEVLATTLTVKEKESFLTTMCQDHGGTHNDEPYYFFKLRNGELNGRGTHHDICGGQLNMLLAWVPYRALQRNYAQELNPKERMNYIAKATDVEREKTELCHFRHADLVTNITANLFTCVVMIFEDNFYGFDANINVLVEIQPLMYEVRNVTHMPWKNVTESYKTMLGHAELKNPSSGRKQIYGSISYAFVEKVRLNASSIYGDSLEKLPLLLEHRGAVLELDANGVGGVDVKEKAYFGRTMDPKTTVKVDVIGQWAERHQEFTADIYEYFGYGIKRFRHELHKGVVSLMRIERTEPVFEMLDSTHTASATLHKTAEDKKQEFERLTDGANKSTNPEWTGEDYTERPRGGHPYPGFYPWSVAGAIIVGVVLLAVVIGMVRHCSKDEDKHKYKIAGP